ncbi:uncharacterized protein C8A04DRAFT_25157 [Dichotomopilus funicola]|uniref:Uncharacterized protein n=1 Tax=Dichotomopilus funicola TaxID=1934379 RepID=A0AAN6ZQW4_9PEZI|nr:hypothetical protein C8A04DRAFT_25157 [Dichotomopilus funicola]
MSSEVFRRVGRGGAGNFYSQQDVQEADRVSKEDIEAQTADPLTLTRTTTAGTTSGQPGPGPSYTRAGRGGAGNFTFPSPTTDSNGGAASDAAAAAAKQPEEAAAAAEADRLQVTDAVAASLATRAKTGGLSGRGGAGNWATGTDSIEIREREKAERVKAAELSRKALEDVELGLAVPQRVYTRRN